ncbi:hypothetical protein [Vibrio sinaloensis]|uniref:hypothetical protein n=1 Tax=Photobacterium sp. (strain ATCC 43367) TaxID=379097 RepID=UPI0035E8142E
MARILSITLGWMFLAGCSALEQSALVYNSTISFGAGFEVDAQGTGFDANVGYKQNDFAYVPIAVSEKKKETDAKNINTHKGSSWEVISASSNVPGAGDISTSARASEDFGNLEASLNDIEKQQLALSMDKVTVESLMTKKQQLETEKEDLVTRIKNDDAGTGNDSKEALETKLGSIQIQLEMLNKIVERTRVGTESNMKDAYSVYGTFDSKGDGNSSGTSIKLGRVFSTGVASQKLAKAVQISAEASYADSVSSCISILGAAIKQGKTQEQIAEISPDVYKICGNMPSQ